MNTHRKKLIEVALPLDAINAASAREKSIRHGHPSTLHLWWARRPLAAARAVIFAQMVDDPSAWPEEFPTQADQKEERERLFDIIKDLVIWKNTTNEQVLEKARAEIRKSWRRTCAENTEHPRATELFNPDKLPAFHDPFAGGGALPLEAQRLGLEAHASDLNPVAVLINKAMIEIPPRFAGRPPVNPEARASISAQVHPIRKSPCWERGRPARTRPGTAADIFPIWINLTSFSPSRFALLIQSRQMSLPHGRANWRSKAGRPRAIPDARSCVRELNDTLDRDMEPAG